MTVKERLISEFQGREFALQDAYDSINDKPNSTVRGRILENLGIAFERVGHGVYKVIDDEEQCILIEGDGRDLSFLPNDSVDCIITDHPWLDEKANVGGSRNFATYDCFEYTLEDFKEKARVMKPGCFLVEFIPAESETNFDYLYKLKKMAQEAGFEYYSKVPWKKGTFVANTGRKAKNTEDIMIFSLGKARALRPDAKKDKAEPGVEHFMKGTKEMLPTEFNVQSIAVSKRLVQSEKPVGVIEQILEYVTFENEVVLDSFAGSGVTGEACLNKNRKCILIEKAQDKVDIIKNRLNMVSCSEDLQLCAI